MTTKLSRRDFLKLSALSAAAASLNRLVRKIPTIPAAAQSPDDDPVSPHHKPTVIYVKGA